MIDFDFDTGVAHNENYNSENSTAGNSSAFQRDNRDNKILKDIQVKDISKYTDEDTIYAWDFDSYPFSCASLIEDDYIVATEIATGNTYTKETITEFWGTGKGVSPRSWVGIENVKRELEGLPEWTRDSFTIEHKKKLQTKFINSQTGERFKNPKKVDGVVVSAGDDHKYKKRVNKGLEDIIEILELRVNKVAQQWGINKDKILFCLGEGDNFRHELDLPQRYKGQRDGGLRPILLKETRQWVRDNWNSEDAPKGFECDDLVEHKAAISAKHYRKTGKHSYVIIASDKDALGNEKLLINPDRSGKDFKFPQAMLIESSDKNLGTLELVQKKSSIDLKGSGLKWLVMQAFCIGDQADFYHPYNKFDDDVKKKIDYGQTYAYKDFVNLKTQKDVLQKAVDNLFKWFPKGIKYKNHKGEDLDVDTFTWAETIFKTAYMTRSVSDKTTFKILCDYFEVDYSKLVENNIEKVYPFVEEEKLRLVVKDTVKILEDLIEDSSNQKGKKDDLIGRLQNSVNKSEEAIATINNMFQH